MTTLAVLIFWILDSYYLTREKQYRNLYEERASKFLDSQYNDNNKKSMEMLFRMNWKDYEYDS